MWLQLQSCTPPPPQPVESESVPMNNYISMSTAGSKSDAGHSFNKRLNGCTSPRVIEVVSIPRITAKSDIEGV